MIILKHIIRLKLKNRFGDPLFGAHIGPNLNLFFTNNIILETFKCLIYTHKISYENSTSRAVSSLKHFFVHGFSQI